MKSCSLLFGLLLLVASSRADEVLPAWKAIGDDASANAVVRRGAGQPPVRYGDLTRKGSVELPADGPRPRVEWDFKLPCDLSQARGVSFDFRCDDVSGLKGAAFYFKSGGGWYSASLMIDEEGEWQHVEILKSKVRGVEGNPGGWDKVELFRLALDRGADRKATQAAIADFAVIPQPGEGEIKVAVVQGAWASRQKGAESGAILSYAAQLSSELTRIGVANAIFADETLTEANLRGVKVVALAYNPSLPPSALKVLEAFVARGGRLFVCYSLPQGVSRLIGVRAAAYYRSGQQGDPPIGGLLRSGAGLDGQPAFAPQDSGNSSVPALLGEGEVVATWADALKRPLAGKPALLRTPTGVYMSHVWRPDPRKEKRQLLCAICAALAPELKADFAAAEAARAKLDAEVRAFVKSVPGKAGERRLAWCHNARGLAGHEHDWEYSVRVLKESGFTDLIVNLSWGDRAFYASKVLEVDPSVGTDSDALEQCLAACRKYGVKCHAWKVCYNTGGRIDRERAKRFAEEGRFVKLFSAKSANAWSHTFCPSHPENMKREAKAMVELAEKGVDGIHFDYIRYMNGDSCFCDGCRTRFEKACGVAVANWPADVRKDRELAKKWTEWRVGNITKVVKAVGERVHARHPGVEISVAARASVRGAYEGDGQDWVGWAKNGWVDFLCPMDYTPSTTFFRKTYLEQREALRDAKVKLYPGIGLSCWGQDGTEPQRMAKHIQALRKDGLEGFSVFNFDARAEQVFPILTTGPTSK